MMTSKQLHAHAHRCGAYFIDGFLLYLLTFALLLLVYGTIYLDDPSAYWGPASLVISYLVPPFLILTFWLKKSATPGKMAIAGTVVVKHKAGVGEAVRFEAPLAGPLA